MGNLAASHHNATKSERMEQTDIPRSGEQPDGWLSSSSSKGRRSNLYFNQRSTGGRSHDSGEDEKGEKKPRSRVPSISHGFVDPAGSAPGSPMEEHRKSLATASVEQRWAPVI